MPELDRIAADFQPKGVGFLAVAIDSDEQKVKQTVAQLKLKMPVAIGQSEVLEPFGANQIPSMAFVTKDGVISGVASGQFNREFVIARIKELASETP